MVENMTVNKKTLLQKLEFFLPRIFLLITVLMAFFSPRTAEMRTFSIIFISILFEALPFMLIGSLVGGFIEEFVSRDRVTGFFPAGSNRSVFVAAAIGFILPVCECAIVPVVRRLLGKGVPFSAAIAYLMAGPIVNPIVAFSTAVAYNYDWKIVAIRTILGYVAAVIIGLLINWLIKEGERFAPEKKIKSAEIVKIVPLATPGDTLLRQEKKIPVHINRNIHDHCCESHSGQDHKPLKSGFLLRIVRAVKHGGDDFIEVACFLVAGAFFAAAAQTFIDRQYVVGMMSQSWIAIAVMMLFAIALNLCSEADAFVAASLRSLVGMPGQMAFMLLGPMFDIKLFFMYFSVFSRKTAIYLAFVTFAVVYVLSMLVSPLLPTGTGI